MYVYMLFVLFSVINRFQIDQRECIPSTVEFSIVQLSCTFRGSGVYRLRDNVVLNKVTKIFFDTLDMDSDIIIKKKGVVVYINKAQQDVCRNIYNEGDSYVNEKLCLIGTTLMVSTQKEMETSTTRRTLSFSASYSLTTATTTATTIATQTATTTTTMSSRVEKPATTQSTNITNVIIQTLESSKIHIETLLTNLADIYSILLGTIVGVIVLMREQWNRIRRWIALLHHLRQELRNILQHPVPQPAPPQRAPLRRSERQRRRPVRYNE